MAPYRLAPARARATTLVLIASLHAAVAAAVLALGGPQAVLKRLPLLEVSFISAPPRPLTVSPAPLPVPRLRAPDIAPPPLPSVEIAIASPLSPQPSEPAPAPRASPAVAPTPPTTEALPPLSPRFDLAYLRNPAPAYPPLSRRLKEQGRVLLRVRVDSDGAVQAIELAASSGHPRLDQAALSAVRQWRFSPARAAGQAVPGWAVVPVVFELSAQA